MIRILINTNGAAFQDGNLETEAARILEFLATFFRDEYVPSAKPVFDVNGNRVGICETVDDAP